MLEIRSGTAICLPRSILYGSGIDVSPRMVELARSHHSTLDFRVADGGKAGLGRPSTTSFSPTSCRTSTTCSGSSRSLKGESPAMAETKRMTAEQVVSYLLEEDGLDFVRESLTGVVQQRWRRRCRSSSVRPAAS